MCYYVIFKFSTSLVFHRLPRFNKPGLLPFRQLLKQMTQQQFREKELNYFKFSTIVLERFPKALHLTFKTMWENNLTHLHSHHLWDDSTAVRNFFLTLEGGKIKVPTHLS